MILRIPILVGVAVLVAFASNSHVAAAGIYYTDQPGGADGSVRLVGLDGTGQRAVVTYSGAPSLRGIAWHRPSGRIYFLDNAAEEIRSIFPDGTGQQTVTAVNAQLLGSDVEIDDAAGKLYWSLPESIVKTTDRRALSRKLAPVRRVGGSTIWKRGQ